MTADPAIGDPAAGSPAAGRFGPGWRLAFTTFTVLPLRPGRVDRAVAGTAMTLAPAVGVALAAVVAAEAAALRRLLPGGPGALLVAVLAVATLALLTRGMHLDGLADTADGLGAYGSAERALAAMKASDVGAFGAVALVLAVGVDTAALGTAVAAGRGPLALAVAVVAGRLAVVWSCTPRTPAARPDGLGALVAGTTSRRAAAAQTAAATLLAAAWGGTGGGGGYGAGRAAVAVLAAVAAAHALRAHAVRRFGGVTGDVLGALIELATAVALVVVATSAPTG